MEPVNFCKDAIRELQGQTTAEQLGIQRHQRIVVLAYFVQHGASEHDFAAQLRLLAESADRSSRAGLASATRAILQAWESRTSHRFSVRS